MLIRLIVRLEIEDKRIVEVAAIITEADLTVSYFCLIFNTQHFQEVASYGPVVIGQPEDVLENMSKWCKKTFKKNGLLERIKKSQVTETQVETEVIFQTFK